MFGLEKLRFKTKVIIVSVIVIIISMGIVYIRNTHPITVVKIDDWVFITSNDEGKWYYKANLINIDNQTHIITVWIKIVYTDIGRHDFIKTHNEEKYKDIYQSLSLVLIDYQKMNYHEERVVYYTNSGEILGSDELSVKSREFIPKSVGDKLLIKILEDYNIKR
ncbi:MAG: hypothetical protein WAL29_03600 [Bacteroidales bacterium]